MLGVSIHALQLTNILPSHLVNRLPTIDKGSIQAGKFFSTTLVVLDRPYQVRQHGKRVDKMTIVRALVEFRKTIDRWLSCVILSSFWWLLYLSGEPLSVSWRLAYTTVGTGTEWYSLIYVSLANLTAFSPTLPFIVYQIWQFVRPALKEKRRVQSLPTSQLALFALCWGLHLVISLSAQRF